MNKKNVLYIKNGYFKVYFFKKNVIIKFNLNKKI